MLIVFHSQVMDKLRNALCEKKKAKCSFHPIPIDRLWLAKSEMEMEIVKILYIAGSPIQPLL